MFNFSVISIPVKLKNSYRIPMPGAEHVLFDFFSPLGITILNWILLGAVIVLAVLFVLFSNQLTAAEIRANDLSRVTQDFQQNNAAADFSSVSDWKMRLHMEEVTRMYSIAVDPQAINLVSSLKNPAQP